MNEVVEVGTLKCGDWFVCPKGRRGMCLGQYYCPLCKIDHVPVWVDMGKDGLWEYQDWSASYGVTPLPDCTGPDWVAPELRPEIAIDTPVWVRDQTTNPWRKRHFAKWAPDGHIVTYCFGRTSHTTTDSPLLVTWEYYSLRDPNKDPEDE